MNSIEYCLKMIGCRILTWLYFSGCFCSQIPAPDPDSCVQGLVVEHRTSGGRAWSDQTTLDSFYTFEWTQEVHTVAVLSRNSVGLSSRNRNMTLVHGAKRNADFNFLICRYLIRGAWLSNAGSIVAVIIMNAAFCSGDSSCSVPVLQLSHYGFFLLNCFDKSCCCFDGVGSNLSSQKEH